MKLLLLLLIAVICNEYCNANSDNVPKMNFVNIYKALSQKRNPFHKDGVPWKKGRKYVADQFRYFGCRNVTKQNFNTTVAGEKVTGVNIIGLREGLNKTGPIVIVGADYDTNRKANPHKDNRGGIASLLEVIHIFSDRIDWNPYHLNYTVIFVAFDLNTRAYANASATEYPGSYYFIHDWLLPYMNAVSLPGQNSTLLGAIILDSITNYNMEMNSQNLTAGFKEVMPEAYKEINETGFKGDFLGLLYPSAEKTNKIIKTFSDNFNTVKTNMSLPFRLQNMEVTKSLNLKSNSAIRSINHQSHYYFWTNQSTPLPAFLLFDTGLDRKDPVLGCKVKCSVNNFLTEKRIWNLGNITTAVWKTLLDLQATKYEIIAPSSGQTASAIFFLVASAVCSCALLK